MTERSSLVATILADESAECGLSLTRDEINSFTVLADELKKWNNKINLTAIRSEKEIAVKHFVDSLHLSTLITSEDRLLDIGSGAGFPVLPLKIVKPATEMMSVDCVAKKINFQRHIIRTLRLPKIEAVHARVEELHKKYEHTFSVIVSRAFTRLDHFVSLAAPLLSEGGRLIAMKGDDVENEIEVSDSAISALGFCVASTQRYCLPYSMGKRTITVLIPREAA